MTLPGSCLAAAIRGRRIRGWRRRAGARRVGAARAGSRRAGAMTTAVGASHRLPCAARLGVARRNSLRSLRELRSDNRRENDERSALRAPTPRLRCSAPPRSPRLGGTQPARRQRAGLRLAAASRSGCVDGVRGEDGAVARERHRSAGKGAGRLRLARLVRRREAQECRPAREARFVPLTRGDCPSGARDASVASFAAGPALRASQGTPAKRGQAPGAPTAGGPRLCQCGHPALQNAQRALEPMT